VYALIRKKPGEVQVRTVALQIQHDKQLSVVIVCTTRINFKKVTRFAH